MVEINNQLVANHGPTYVEMYYAKRNVEYLVKVDIGICENDQSLGLQILLVI